MAGHGRLSKLEFIFTSLGSVWLCSYDNFDYEMGRPDYSLYSQRI